ncbi:MAG: hypothetical protein U0931_29980 [Vulcanimicrobiota bacterium]
MLPKIAHQEATPTTESSVSFSPAALQAQSLQDFNPPQPTPVPTPSQAPPASPKLSPLPGINAPLLMEAAPTDSALKARDLQSEIDGVLERLRKAPPEKGDVNAKESMLVWNNTCGVESAVVERLNGRDHSFTIIQKTPEGYTLRLERQAMSGDHPSAVRAAIGGGMLTLGAALNGLCSQAVQKTDSALLTTVKSLDGLARSATDPFHKVPGGLVVGLTGLGTSVACSAIGGVLSGAVRFMAQHLHKPLSAVGNGLAKLGAKVAGSPETKEVMYRKTSYLPGGEIQETAVFGQAKEPTYDQKVW